MILLSGFMGAGKTTVGAIVAHKLSCPFVDLDQLIEESEGLPIFRILSVNAEAHFRALEAHYLRSLFLQSRLVLALGGGTLQGESLALILDQTSDPAKSHFWISLLACQRTLEDRLRVDPNPVVRPLLVWEDSQRTRFAPFTQKLLEKREAVYRGAPNCVHTDALPPANVAETILNLVGHQVS